MRLMRVVVMLVLVKLLVVVRERVVCVVKVDG